MLYKCEFAKTIWDTLNHTSKFIIAVEDVILGERLGIIDMFIISAISYFIYKMWLRNSFDDIPRDINNVIPLLKSELEYIHTIYSALKCEDLCINLKNIINNRFCLNTVLPYFAIVLKLYLYQE